MCKKNKTSRGKKALRNIVIILGGITMLISMPKHSLADTYLDSGNVTGTLIYQTTSTHTSNVIGLGQVEWGSNTPATTTLTIWPQTDDTFSPGSYDYYFLDCPTFSATDTAPTAFGGSCQVFYDQPTATTTAIAGEPYNITFPNGTLGASGFIPDGSWLWIYLPSPYAVGLSGNARSFYSTSGSLLGSYTQGADTWDTYGIGGGILQDGEEGYASLEFTYPENSASTGLFSNWLLHASNLSAQGSYEMQVTWTATLPDGTVTAPLQNIVGNTSGSEPDWYATVPRTDWPFNFASNVTVNATGYLYDSQDPNNPNADSISPIVIASTTESFTLLSIASSSPSSSLNTGGLVTIDTQDQYGNITTSSISGFIYTPGTNPNSTPTFNCTAPASISDIGNGIAYAFCEAMNYAFNPDVLYNSTGYFSTQLNNMEQVPPFSAFFALANSATSGIGGASSSSASSSAGISIGILGLNGQEQEIVTLGSSSFYGGFAGATTSTSQESHASMDYLETFIEAWLWIAAGIKILYVFAVNKT